MSRLDDLIEHHPVPSLRPLTWVIMIVLGVLIVWASAAQLDEVASADGEVVPRGQIKVIQHLEGGTGFSSTRSTSPKAAWSVSRRAG